MCSYDVYGYFSCSDINNSCSNIIEPFGKGGSSKSNNNKQSKCENNQTYENRMCLSCPSGYSLNSNDKSQCIRQNYTASSAALNYKSDNGRGGCKGVSPSKYKIHDGNRCYEGCPDDNTTYDYTESSHRCYQCKQGYKADVKTNKCINILPSPISVISTPPKN